MKLYSVTYSTESGDRGFVGIFTERPTDGHLSAIAVRDFPCEVEDYGNGPRRLIWFQVAESEIATLPEPIDPIPTI